MAKLADLNLRPEGPGQPRARDEDEQRRADAFVAQCEVLLDDPTYAFGWKYLQSVRDRVKDEGGRVTDAMIIAVENIRGGGQYKKDGGSRRGWTRRYEGR